MDTFILGLITGYALTILTLRFIDAYHKEQKAREELAIKKKAHKNLIATLHRIRDTPYTPPEG